MPKKKWKPLRIRGELFKYKKDLKEKVQGIRNLWINRDIDKDSETHRFLLELLQKQHYNSNQKEGEGIDHFSVGWKDGNYCFFLTRTGEKEATDVSILKKCIDGPDSQDPLRELYKALRSEIASQTIGFRNNFFSAHKKTGTKALCPITGEEINKRSCHVDHIAPATFKQLADVFIEHEQLDPEDVELRGQGIDNSSQLFLQDLQLASRWKKYHQDHAQLRVLSIKGHQSLPKTNLV